MRQCTFQDLVRSHIVPGEVSILGITGQAGAGKTSHICPLVKTLVEETRHPAEILKLDAFFKLSSRARQEWLNEKGISPEERAWRADQINWWNFDLVQRVLDDLQKGKEVHLTGVYNRAEGGELTGEIHFTPPTEGMVIIFDGVGICHLQRMKELAYVHAPAGVRLSRLQSRDQHRKGAEVLERFWLTQAFEVPYFQKHWGLITCWLDNSRQDPQMLPELDHAFALSEDGISGKIVHFEQKAG